MDYHIHQGIKVRIYNVGLKRRWKKGAHASFKAIGTWCPIESCSYTPNSRANDISARAKAAIERLKSS